MPMHMNDKIEQLPDFKSGMSTNSIIRARRGDYTFSVVTEKCKTLESSSGGGQIS